MSLARASAVPATFRYRLYGLAIESDIDLGWIPTGGPAGCDPIRIVRTGISLPRIDRGEPLTFIDAGSEQLFVWSMVGAFRIVSDTCVEVDPNPGVADSLVALPLLGTVFAALLQRCGLTVFHASAVAVDGRAVVLLGHKGAGKSTTAGALVAAGHALIADDVVAVDLADPTEPFVLPAAAQLRLWDDSRASLGAAGITDLGRLHGAIDKSLYALRSGATEPVPLARFYLVGRSLAPTIRPMPPAEAISALLNQSYMARFGERGFGATMPTHFARLARLTGAAPTKILAVPASLDRLDEIAPLIQADLATG